MFGWLWRRRRPEEHEPEVEQAKHEQRDKFNAWENTMVEVQRVQGLAEKHHADLHRSRPR